MNKSFTSCLALFCLTAAFLSCGGGRKGDNQAVAGKADTAKAVKEVQPLPDTMYASAEVVKYHVDVYDSLPHPLKGLDGGAYATDDVLTFRKTLLRDADFGGRISGTPDSIAVEWKFETEYDKRKTKYGTWGGGSGWTGQPLYLAKTGEIVVGSLCGKVYFINFETGKASRSPLNAVNPIKGTISKDPELENLYVGQGVPAEQPFGAMAFDLKKHSRGFFFGRDPKAKRGWNAFDSSPVVVGGYLFWPGENGSLYKFERTQGSLKLVSALRYTVNGAAPGVENSLCVYRNYAYFGDNHGSVICVNLETMKPVWRYDIGDDIDGSIVCHEENGTPYLYVGCEVGRQGDSGVCRLAKLNGVDGSQVWRQELPCKRYRMGEKTLDGGIYCTPLLGRGDADGLVFLNICRHGGDGHSFISGQFVAFSTKDGHVVYATQLNQFAWSSPVSFLNERGEDYVFTGDSGGHVYLIRAKTGDIIYKKSVAANFESSPVVVGNAAVVGSRQNGIYKFVIK